MWSAFLFGFSITEVVWEKSEGDFFIKNFLDYPAYNFSFDYNSRCQYDGAGKLTYLDEFPNNFILYRWGSSRYPYGYPVGRYLYYPCFFKRMGQKYWIKYLEKFAFPTVVGKYDSAAGIADPNFVDSFLSNIANLKHNSGIVIPADSELDLLEARAKSGGDYEQAMEYLDRGMSLRILGQVKTSEGGVGSLASLKEAQKIERGIADGDAFSIGNNINNSLVRWLVDINFGVQKFYPKLSLESSKSLLDGENAIDDITKLVKLGVKIPIDYITEGLGIPTAEKGDAVLEMAQSIKNLNSRFVSFSNKDAIENLLDREEFTALASKEFSDKIIKLANESGDKDDFVRRLKSADFNEGTDVLATAMLYAGVFGRNDTDNDKYR